MVTCSAEYVAPRLKVAGAVGKSVVVDTLLELHTSGDCALQHTAAASSSSATRPRHAPDIHTRTRARERAATIITRAPPTREKRCIAALCAPRRPCRVAARSIGHDAAARGAGRARCSRVRRAHPGGVHAGWRSQHLLRCFTPFGQSRRQRTACRLAPVGMRGALACRARRDEKRRDGCAAQQSGVRPRQASASRARQRAATAPRARRAQPFEAAGSGGRCGGACARPPPRPTPVRLPYTLQAETRAAPFSQPRRVGLRGGPCHRHCAAATASLGLQRAAAATPWA